MFDDEVCANLKKQIEKLRDYAKKAKGPELVDVLEDLSKLEDLYRRKCGRRLE